MKRRWLALVIAVIMMISVPLSLTSCNTENDPAQDNETAQESEAQNEGDAQSEGDDQDADSQEDVPENDAADKTADASGVPLPDMNAWKYNKKHDVYYQLGITYCANPADEDYEKLAVFVPGKFMKGKKNDGGTYSCEIDPSAKVGGFTAATAPIVMPVDAPGYSSQQALTEYTKVKKYTDAGFVYVHAGCRGRDKGAPLAVTDLKAAVRYLRYSADQIPGDEESIFMFGMGGGGALAAVMGASGDSSMYDPYLALIGAVSETSDVICGAMCWSPVTDYDTANGAYEWMMGSTRSGLTEEEHKISDELAANFADYMNTAGLTSDEGRLLTLRESEEGIYQSGTYYDYMKSVVEKALNRFLKDTKFPYKAKGTTEGGLKLTGSYDTPADYVKKLNSKGKWLKYNAKKNKVTVRDLAGFVKVFKPATRGLAAFDNLEGTENENILFGYGDGEVSHFDPYLAEILNNINSKYAGAYVRDLSKTDSIGNSVDYRVEMYTPMYFLLRSQSGYQKSTVAYYWRIRSGIEQTDCALCTEVNLALALQNYSDVRSVDFATVWGKGHVKAERSGKSADNFIKWVGKCMKKRYEG